MNSTINSVLINDAKEYILNNIELQKTCISQDKDCSILYVSGPPGIGKSAIMNQLCEEKNYGLIVKYMGTMLIEQITGLPNGHVKTEDNSIAWSLPELFSLKNFRGDYRKKDDDVIVLFLDDAHLCNKSIQSYMFQLLSYRSIHGHKLLKNIVIILAGNRSTDRAGFQPILAPVSNRMHFIDVYNDVEDWVKNFAAQYGVRDDFISFLLYNPDKFQSEPLESVSWASPRSWTYASDAMNIFEKTHKLKIFSIAQLQILINGHVGTENASKFIEYYQLFKKWDTESILSGKMNLPDLEKLGKENKIECYSLLSAVISTMLRDIKLEKMNIKSEKIKIEVKVMKKLLSGLLISCKEIIPFGLKSFLNIENGTEKSLLLREILNDNKYLVECMLQMTK